MSAPVHCVANGITLYPACWSQWETNVLALAVAKRLTSGRELVSCTNAAVVGAAATIHVQL